MKESLVKLEGITKSYDGQMILDDLNLDIYQNSFVTLLGPSGCGKTTTLRIIGGFETPDKGKVIFDGQDITSLPPHKRALNTVFQKYALFPNMTIKKNITLAPTQLGLMSKEDADKKALELLERVGLLDKADSYPDMLSGGQKQRVAIVRALCMHPEILLFDEVTAALDPEMVREVLDVILDLAAQGRTMIIVTHEMQFARAVADRIIFLEGGKIQEDETPDEFFEHPKTDRAKKFLNTFTFESVKRDI